MVVVNDDCIYRQLQGHIIITEQLISKMSNAVACSCFRYILNIQIVKHKISQYTVDVTSPVLTDRTNMYIFYIYSCKVPLASRLVKHHVVFY